MRSVARGCRPAGPHYTCRPSFCVRSPSPLLIVFQLIWLGLLTNGCIVVAAWQLIEEVKKVKLTECPEKDAGIHKKCPGHVTYEDEPERPCPNCSLVGTKFGKTVGESAPATDDEPMFPANSNILERASEAEAKQAVFGGGFQ